MNEIPIKWGLLNNEIVHISSVNRGKKCNCICPICKTPLIAHQGEDLTYHFKHESVGNCKGSIETSIHRAAKELILRKKKIFIPDLYLKSSSGEMIKVVKNKCYKPVKINIEEKLYDIVPDIYLEVEFVNDKGDKIIRGLIVEIAVTHFIDEEKFEKIKKMNISCIEIQVKNLEKINDINALWKIIKKEENISWIHNSRKEYLQNKANKIGLIERAKLSALRTKEFELWEKKNEIRLKEKLNLLNERYLLKKIYNYSKHIESPDIMGYKSSYSGHVYCEKKLESTNDEKIEIEKCKMCVFHKKIYFEGINFDAQPYTVCGINLTKISNKKNL